MSTLREKILRLASEKPALRPHLLPLLRKTAMEFPTQDALTKYLKEHPDADKSNHSVKKDFAKMHPVPRGGKAVEMKDPTTGKAKKWTWKDMHDWAESNLPKDKQQEWLLDAGDAFRSEDTKSLQKMMAKGSPSKTAAAPKKEFAIYVDYASMETTEDNYEKGEIGQSQVVWEKKHAGPFKSAADLLRYFASSIGVPEDKETWGVFEGEEGRIEASWTVNNDNSQASPQEFAAWKKGQLRLWTARLSVYVVFATKYVPDDKELLAVTKLRAI